ncbi:chaperonin 10-like protein [Dactylonectria estremocensis]|uniref:Chaperonin 10-like protein n=1 Tax=Dactylonectria estremocensis TaxID=1079267 RepID=A0A9P9J2Q6_9HYPO|nr:chaperonin 10-like protein [Dactylonectria estremocensis]
MTADSIPSLQLAAVLTGVYGMPHTLRSDLPVSRPGAGQVLIKLEASGVCSGDVNPRDGYPPAPKMPRRPLVTGHEGVGIVVVAGDGVTAFKVGDRVGMGWRSEVCWSCGECARGRDNLCQNQKMSGYETNGTFQEYITISSTSLIPIPSTTVPAASIAPLLCAGGTALAGLRATGVSAPGEWVCVTGAAGGVGGLACRYALHMGLSVVAIDSAQKATVCEAMGVHAFVDYETADTVVSRIRDLTGGKGAVGVVVCSANPASYSQAVEYAAVGGRIVSIGPSMVHLHTGPMMVKGLALIAQCNGSTKDIQDAVRLGVEEGILPHVELVQLSEIDDALDKLKAGKALTRQVIKW